MADVTSERVQRAGINVSGDAAATGGDSNQNGDAPNGDSGSRNSEQVEDASLELYNITQQILEFLK